MPHRPYQTTVTAHNINCARVSRKFQFWLGGWWWRVRVDGELFGVFGLTTMKLEHGYYGLNGSTRILKTPEYVSLIAEPVRDPYPWKSVASV